MASAPPPHGFRPPPPPSSSASSSTSSSINNTLQTQPLAQPHAHSSSTSHHQHNHHHHHHHSHQQPRLPPTLTHALPPRPNFSRPPPPPPPSNHSSSRPSASRPSSAHSQLSASLPLQPLRPLSDRHCEFCNTEFESEQQVNAHIKLVHIACNFCMFMGTRDALDAHYNTKHPGKAPAVKTKVEDPAEIAAWIAERKKKYPTKDAVQQKKQTHQEKLDSGMILQTRQTATKSHTTRQTTDTSAASPSSPTKKRRRNSLSDGPDANNDDEEGQIHSSDDDDEDDKLDAPESSGKPVHKKKQLPCKYFASGKCKNGDNCMFLHIKEASIGPEKPALGGGKRRNLRSMLLEGQVRRQNNIILQCIRFLIKDGRLVKPVEDGSGKGKGKAVESERVSETKQEVKDMEDVSDHMSVS